MVKQPDVRSCLLYAACLGGNIDVVRKFLTPDLDINHSVQLVRTFQNSESLTPLYAACAGNVSILAVLLSETVLRCLTWNVMK